MLVFSAVPYSSKMPLTEEHRKALEHTLGTENLRQVCLAPHESKFLNGRDGNVQFFAVPEPYCGKYYLPRILSQPLVLPLENQNPADVMFSKFDSVSIDGNPVGMIDSNIYISAADSILFLTALNNAWVIRGETLEHIMSRIANAVLATGVKRPMILSCWKCCLDMLFDALGPPRSVAILWKLYGCAGTLTVTQIGERAAFTILAGIFPGHIRLIDADSYECFETSMETDLCLTISHLLVSRGWLPGGPSPHDSFPCPNSDLGACIRRDSVFVVGHRRWLCVEPLDVGTLTREHVINCAISLAKMRGVLANIKHTYIIDRMEAEELINMCHTIVVCGGGPLVVAFKAESLREEYYEVLRKYLFPYASIILCIGSSCATKIDPRVSTLGRLTPNENFPPYNIHYRHEPFSPAKIRTFPAVIITVPSVDLSRAFGDVPAVVFTDKTNQEDLAKPVHSEGSGAKLLIFSMVRRDPEAVLPPVRRSPAAMKILENTCTVFVLNNPNWEYITMYLMHLQKMPFTINVY